jgi:hypothetical protein
MTLANMRPSPAVGNPPAEPAIIGGQYIGALSLSPGDGMAPVAAGSWYLMRCADVGALGAISIASVERHQCGRAAPHGGVAILYAPVVADSAIDCPLRDCCARNAARRNR